MTLEAVQTLKIVVTFPSVIYRNIDLTSEICELGKAQLGFLKQRQEFFSLKGGIANSKPKQSIYY